MREVEPDKDVRLAERAESEGRWLDALAAWRKITQQRPEPNWLVRYGLALKEAGQLEEAQQALLSAVATEPRWAEPLFQLGLLFREQGRFGEAREYLEKGLAIEERPEIWNILGFVTREMGDLPASERAYKRALELDAKDDEAHYGLGWILKRSDPARAVEHLSEALRLDPTLRGVHRELGHALWYAGRYDEAEQAIVKAVQNDPSDTWAHAYLGHLLRRRGQLKDAREAFQAAVDLEPSFPSFRIPLAEVCEELGALAIADQLFRDTLAKDPNDPLTNLKYGLFLKRRRLFQKATRYLERALRQNPSEERARRALAEIRAQESPDVVLRNSQDNEG